MLEQINEFLRLATEPLCTYIKPAMDFLLIEHPWLLLPIGLLLVCVILKPKRKKTYPKKLNFLLFLFFAERVRICQKYASRLTAI